MIKAGIIGSTGYAGGELVRILTGHKGVEINGTVPEAISIKIMQMYTAIFFKSWMRSVWMITWTRWQIRWM